MNFNVTFFHKLIISFLFIFSIFLECSNSYAECMSYTDTPIPSEQAAYLALTSAIREGNLDRVKCLKKADLKTTLFNFIEYPEVVRALIAEGVDVNARYNNDNTPLHFAVENPGVTQILLEAGANPSAQNYDGISPLHNAINPDVARMLIEAGADIEARANDLRRLTPLQLAIHRGNIEVATVLTEAGADIEARDSDAQTPLFYARDTASVDLLLDAGANIEARDRFDKTLIFRFVYPEVVGSLVRRGADVHAISGSGQTPIGNARRRVEDSDPLIITDTYIKNKEILNTLNGVDPVFIKCESALLRVARVLSAY